MISIKQQYIELLHLTEIFLRREYSSKSVKRADPATFSFFQRNTKPSEVEPAEKKICIPPFTPLQPKQNFSPPTVKQVSSLKQEVAEPPLPKESLPPAGIQQNQSNALSLKTDKYALEPLIFKEEEQNLSEFHKIFSSLFPQITINESIPSDKFAQKKKNAWQNHEEIPPVIILSFQDSEKHLAFLKNIAKAISLRLSPARVLLGSPLEKNNEWEKVLQSPNLRLIIANDYALYLQPKLMGFYKEQSGQGKHFLNKTPLLLLSDPSLYLKQPQLKPLLWRAICNEFASSI